MIWLKRLLLWIVALCALLMVVLCSLTLTEPGNRWLWQKAKQALPALQGELVAGSLGSGWRFNDLAWQDEGLQLRIAKAELKWDLTALLQRRLWIQSLTLTQPSVTIPDSLDKPIKETNEPFSIAYFPLLIQVDKLAIDALAVSQHDVMVKLKTLHGAGQFDKHGLLLNLLNSQGLEVILRRALDAKGLDKNLAQNQVKATAKNAGDSHVSVASKAAKPSVASQDSGSDLLPSVSLPFPIVLRQGTLKGIRYQQDDWQAQVSKLSVQGQMADEQLTLDNIVIEHAMARLTGKGQMRFEHDYPLDLNLMGVMDKSLLEGQLAGQKWNLALSGSLEKLAVQLVGKGGINANLKGRVEPLRTEVPFDLALNWPHLQWPLNPTLGQRQQQSKSAVSANRPTPQEVAKAPSYQLDKGQFSAKGSLKDYRVILKTAGKGSNIPPFTLTFEGKGDSNAMRELNLNLAALKGALDVSGQLVWQKGLQWQGHTQFKNIDPHALVAQLSGALSGQFASSFKLDEANHWQLALSDLAINGQLNQYPFKLHGNVQGDDQMRWQMDKLTLLNGTNRLMASGRVDEQDSDLSAQIEAPQLANLYPALKGDLQGNVRLIGSLKAPQLVADLRATRLRYGELLLQQVTLKSQGEQQQQVQGAVAIHVARLQQGQNNLHDIALTLSGSQQAHQLTLVSKGEPFAANMTLNGGLRDTLWRGQVTQLALTTPLKNWTLSAPWALEVNGAQQWMKMADLCLASLGASLCVKQSEVSAKQGNFAFSLAHFDLKRLRPWLPDNFRWRAVLSADGQLGWRADQPTLAASIRTTPGTIVTDGLITPYEQLTASLSFEAKRAALLLDFVSSKIGKVNTHLQIREPNGRGQLSGNLKFDELKLDAFAPLIPEVRSLQGVMAADGRFDGTLAAPLFFGQVQLRDGALQTHTDMVTVSKIATRLAISGNRAELDGSMLVGKGPLVLGGTLSWAQLPVSGSVTIKGQDLDAQYPGMGRVKVTPDLVLSLGGQTQISGTIDIPWARVLVKALPESAQRVSDDVIIIYDDIPELAPPTPLPMAMDVAIRLGKDVKFDALGLKTDLSGAISIKQDPDKPLSGHGTILLTNGRFKAYGQNLLIKEGKILFSGPLDRPFLDVQANRDPDTIEDPVTVGVRVTGPVTKPVIKVFSEPQMAQSEQLSYLLRGKGLQTSGEDGGFNGLLVAGAVSQANGVVSSIGEALGMSDVSLDTAGSGDNTQVTLSAYLLPGLQFQYGVGVFSPIAEFKLRYELLPRLYLQAMSGVAQAVDLFYRFTL